MRREVGPIPKVAERSGRRIVTPGLAALMVVVAAATDRDPGRPLRSSLACAGCHSGDVGRAFEQWRDSPYSDPDAGVACQDCHQVADLPTSCRAAGGGDEFGLTLPLARPEDRGAIEIVMSAHARGPDELVTEVAVCNRGAGHDLPTGAFAVVLVLAVSAVGSDGVELELAAGPRLPAVAGELAGRPGVLFAASTGGLRPFATEVTQLVFSGRLQAAVVVRARIECQPSKGETGPGAEVVAEAMLRVSLDRLQIPES